MEEFSPEIAAILPILLLLLEGKLKVDVNMYFRSLYTIGTEGYEWDENLDKVIPTGEENQLDDIDRNWLQRTKKYTMRNKQYKDEDRRDCAINVGSFDIERESYDVHALWKMTMNPC